jgi:hypothetical protein
MPKKPKEKDWEKRLSPVSKAEVMAAEFHLLTAHMPEIWNQVPEWLRNQIRQTMCDCSVDNEDFSKQDIKDCAEYCRWLNRKYPPKKPRKKRYLHYALIDDGEGGVGQFGCAWGAGLDDVKKNIDPRDHKFLRRMPQKDCPLCKEDE